MTELVITLPQGDAKELEQAVKDTYTAYTDARKALSEFNAAVNQAIRDVLDSHEETGSDDA